jgi:hypothetical protein
MISDFHITQKRVVARAFSSERLCHNAGIPAALGRVSRRAVQVRGYGAIQTPMPIIISDKRITSASIVSLKGMRFSDCWVIASVSGDPFTVTEEHRLWSSSHALGMDGQSAVTDFGRPEKAPWRHNIPLRRYQQRHRDDPRDLPEGFNGALSRTAPAWSRSLPAVNKSSKTALQYQAGSIMVMKRTGGFGVVVANELLVRGDFA